MNPVALVAACFLLAAPARPGPAGTAMERLAALVAHQILEQKAESPVGVYVRGESAELSRAFGTLLSAELARQNLPPVAVEAMGPVDAEKAARSAGVRSLARLTLTLESGTLAARGDLLGTWVNFWSGGIATRPPTPAAALSAQTEADAQALALAALPAPGPAVPLHPPAAELKLLGAVFAKLPAPSAALAAGDLDGDGRAEVAVLTDEELFVFAPSGKLLARRDHRLLPNSPTPCREPFGAAAILQRPARLAYLSARRARGELLALERGGLKSVGTVEEAPLARVADGELAGQFIPGQSEFAAATAMGGATLTAPASFTTASVHAAPGGFAVLWVMPDGSGALSSVAPGAPVGKLAGLGAGSALADLDGDGRPELVTSSPRFAPEADELRAYALNGTVLGPELWRSAELPKGARVLQIAAADIDGDGVDELLVALWLPDGSGELDVFRRVTP